MIRIITDTYSARGNQGGGRPVGVPREAGPSNTRICSRPQNSGSTIYEEKANADSIQHAARPTWYWREACPSSRRAGRCNAGPTERVFAGHRVDGSTGDGARGGALFGNV